MPTAQEVFNTTLFHLRKQGRAALAFTEQDNQESCRYRTPDGLMCAAGCHIPDEDYDPRMEGVCIDIRAIPSFRPKGHTLLKAVVIKQGLEPHLGLLAQLQTEHDATLAVEGIESWEQEMAEIAKEHGLVYTAPDAAS